MAVRQQRLDLRQVSGGDALEADVGMEGLDRRQQRRTERRVDQPRRLVAERPRLGQSTQR
ncbi:MAG TPA: hypothetical protein PK440_14595 [Candidatus Accumulibacter phosphatis]|nr:hypothetical protein [Candidatus Accumulibacter phosphatis]